MNNKLIINAIQADIGNSLDISTVIFKFNEYKILEDTAENKYIAGSGDIEILGSKSEGQPFKNFGILFSLINLVKKSISKNEWGMNKMKEAIPLEGILNWVNENGIPYETEENREIFGKYYSCGLKINEFRTKIAYLYSKFQLWLALIENDKDEILKYKSILSFNDISNKSLKNALVYDSGLYNFNLIPTYDKENDSFKLQVHTDSLFEAGLFQFYILLTNQIEKDEDGKLKHLKICEYCNKFFWANDSQQKYCPHPDDPNKQSKCRKNAYYHRNK